MSKYKIKQRIEPKKFYICDPLKNTKCNGRGSNHCGKDCFCTTDIRYAINGAKPLTHGEYEKEENKRNVDRS